MSPGAQHPTFISIYDLKQLGSDIITKEKKKLWSREFRALRDRLPPVTHHHTSMPTHALYYPLLIFRRPEKRMARKSRYHRQQGDVAASNGPLNPRPTPAQHFSHTFPGVPVQTRPLSQPQTCSSLSK